jgi:hypothetical protein
MQGSETIEIFLQGEGLRDIKIVRVPKNGIVRDVLNAATTSGVTIPQAEGQDIIVLIEGSDRQVRLDARLEEEGIAHRHRLHFHRCKRVEVTVNFNGVAKTQSFPTSKIVAVVTEWADDQFGLKGVDATEHALQICGTSTRPDQDIAIGSLVHFPDCRLCFDLVPKKRVEG